MSLSAEKMPQVFKKADSGVYIPATPETLPCAQARSQGPEFDDINTVRIAAASHPLLSRYQDYAVPQGMTLEDMLVAVQPDPVLRRHAHIFVEDRLVSRNFWHLVRPKAGALVTIKLVPMGGGKNPLNIILSIAVVALAFTFAGPLGGALVGPAGLTIGATTITAAQIGGAVILAGGFMLVNAIAPIKPPSLSSQGERESPSYFLEGARNALRPYAPIPVILGKHRVVPPLGANVYTEVRGDSNYLRMIVVWGYGPLKIRDIRIGTTPIEEFDDVQIETREGRDTDEPISIYPDDVIQENFSIALEQSTGWVSRTTGPDADEISIDVGFPRGIIRYSKKGKRRSSSVTFQIEFKKTTDTTWSAPTGIGNNGIITVSASRTEPIRNGYLWETDERAQYDVRVRRTSAEPTSDREYNAMVWITLRTFTDRDPINFDRPLAVTALSIRATDQLNRVVDQLNAIVSSEVKDWDGSDWVDAESSNPASLIRHVLQGPAREMPAPDDEIDLAVLQEFHEFCTDHNFEFNAIIDYQRSIWDTLSDIAAVGRASPDWFDGKWSVIVDTGNQLQVQHFGPRNSDNFQMSRAFDQPPHALRLRFNNRDVDWMTDERTVYDDGYDESNAEVFVNLEPTGITDSDHIWGYGRFHLAQIKLRREVWRMTTDLEYMVARRGSRVLLTHDVLLVGQRQARIKAVYKGPPVTVTLDEQVIMFDGNDYGIVVRTVDDQNLTSRVVTDAGQTKELELSNAPSDFTGKADIGDLLSFGEFGKETVDALMITAQPGPDLSASVSLLPWQPGVYTADTEAIPTYDTRITAPSRNPDLMILAVRSDDSTLLPVGAILQPFIHIEVRPINSANASIEAQIRLSRTNDRHRPTNIISQGDDFIVLGNVDIGNDYDLRLRWVIPDDLLPGRWSMYAGHTVVGPTIPAALSNLQLVIIGNGALLRWDAIDNVDIQTGGRIQFRHSPEADPADAEWNDSIPIGQVVQGHETSVMLPLLAGTYIARVFNVSGIAGDDTKVSTKQANILDYLTLVTKTEHTAFSGTKTDVSVTSGGLRLDSGETEGTYDFSSSVTLAEVSRLRATAKVAFTTNSDSNTIDNRDTNIDDWDTFDGATASVTSVEIQLRHTDDDPAGTPAWSEWERIDSGEYEARGLEFRALLRTDDTQFYPQISELSVKVETPTIDNQPGLMGIGASIVYNINSSTAPNAAGEWRIQDGTTSVTAWADIKNVGFIDLNEKDDSNVNVKRILNAQQVNGLINVFIDNGQWIDFIINSITVEAAYYRFAVSMLELREPASPVDLPTGAGIRFLFSNSVPGGDGNDGEPGVKGIANFSHSVALNNYTSGAPDSVGEWTLPAADRPSSGWADNNVEFRFVVNDVVGVTIDEIQPTALITLYKDENNWADYRVGSLRVLSTYRELNDMTLVDSIGDLGNLNTGDDITLHYNLGGGIYTNLWTGTATIHGESSLGTSDFITFDFGAGFDIDDYDHIDVVCYLTAYTKFTMLVDEIFTDDPPLIPHPPGSVIVLSDVTTGPAPHDTGQILPIKSTNGRYLYMANQINRITINADSITINTIDAVRRKPGHGLQDIPDATIPDRADVSLSHGDMQFRATWDHPYNGGAPVTSQRLEWRKSTDTNYTTRNLSATVNSATVTGLENGTQYDVRLRQTNAVGNRYSTIEEVVPRDDFIAKYRAVITIGRNYYNDPPPDPDVGYLLGFWEAPAVMPDSLPFQTDMGEIVVQDPDPDIHVYGLFSFATSRHQLRLILDTVPYADPQIRQFEMARFTFAGVSTLLNRDDAGLTGTYHPAGGIIDYYRYVWTLPDEYWSPDNIGETLLLELT